jgi:BolA protein
MTMTVRDTIERKLSEALTPQKLVVTDDSHRHAGHAGHRPGGESHFSVEVVAQAFAGKSRVERHRLVNGLLAEELAGPVHALALVVKAPGEG